MQRRLVVAVAQLHRAQDAVCRRGHPGVIGGRTHRYGASPESDIHCRRALRRKPNTDRILLYVNVPRLGITSRRGADGRGGHLSSEVGYVAGWLCGKRWIGGVWSGPVVNRRRAWFAEMLERLGNV